MAHSKQAKKRIRVNERRRVQNKAQMSAMRSYFNKIMKAIEEGDRATVDASLTEAIARVDKAGKINLIHFNAASRKKSQLMRAVGRMNAAKS